MTAVRSRLVAASMLTTLIGAVAVVGAAAAASAEAGVGTAVGAGSGVGLADLREEVVLSGAGVNGGRLDLNRFVDSRPAEALREEVRRLWSRRSAPIHSSTREGWLVLTQVDGASVEMLEVRPVGGATEGRWSRLRKGDAGLAQTSAWLEAALPPGSQVLRRLDHDDDARRMTTIVATNPAASVQIREAMVAMLTRKGFMIQSQSVPSFTGEGTALFLRRGTEEIAVTISDHEGHRGLVLHWGRRAP